MGAKYEQFADDELLKLAGEREQLVEEARAALDTEMRKRGLTLADVLTFNSEIKQAEAERNIADVGIFYHYGVGKRFYGRQNLIVGALSGTEEYDTTLWAVVMWFPVVPLSSIRVRRRTTRISRFSTDTSFEVVHSRPRNWGQILRTWVMALATGIVVLYGFETLLELARH